jgi:uncharacterized protein
MDKTKTALSFPTNARPWRFLGITLAVTWLTGFLGVALQHRMPSPLVMALVYGGGLSPLIVAGLMVHRERDRAGRRDFWRRVVDIRRISWAWAAVILLFYPLKSLLAALIDILMGGWGIGPEAISDLLAQPLTIGPMLLFWLLFGPVPEEPGWRGYATDRLQAHVNAVTASLSVGVVWALWHLPLFFLDGTWQAEHLGFGTPRFGLWAMGVIIESVLYTWIYNNTQRSTLAAILFHFVGNAFGQLFALSQRAEILSYGLSILAVAAVIAVWGPTRLRRSPD